jgi:hypothetical protein
MPPPKIGTLNPAIWPILGELTLYSRVGPPGGVTLYPSHRDSFQGRLPERAYPIPNSIRDVFQGRSAQRSYPVTTAML